GATSPEVIEGDEALQDTRLAGLRHGLRRLARSTERTCYPNSTANASWLVRGEDDDRVFVLPDHRREGAFEEGLRRRPLLRVRGHQSAGADPRADHSAQ